MIQATLVGGPHDGQECETIGCPTIKAVDPVVLDPSAWSKTPTSSTYKRGPLTEEIIEGREAATYHYVGSE